MRLSIRSFKYKISIFIIICLFFSLLINALLNYFNFEKSYNDSRRAKFTIIAEDAVKIIEYGLDMGIAPEEMKNIQEVLNNEIQRNFDIVFISVLNKDLKTLFSSYKNDSLIKDNKINEMLNNTQKDNENYRIINLPIKNAFKVDVGFLLLQYSEELGMNPVIKMAFYLLKLFIITLILSSILILLGVSIIFSDLVNDFIKMNNSISNLGKEEKCFNEEANIISDDFNKFQKSSCSVVNSLLKIEKDIDNNNEN